MLGRECSVDSVEGCFHFKAHLKKRTGMETFSLTHSFIFVVLGMEPRASMFNMGVTTGQ